MTILSVAEMKEHLPGTVSVSDDALGRLLNAAESSITEAAGPIDTVTDYRRPSGPLLGLSRKAQGIVSVTENGVELDPDDYELRPSGEVLMRLSTGPHPAVRWRGHVVIELAPADDMAERIRVQVGLVKLDLDYTPGIAGVTTGTWTESSSQQQGITYAQLRNEYLESLVRPWSPV